MKKFVLGLAVGSLITVMGSVFADTGLQKIVAYLNPSVPITLDGNSVKLGNAPVMYNGSNYLKLRDVTKITGLNVNWNEATKTIELSNPSKSKWSGKTVNFIGDSVTFLDQYEPILKSSLNLSSYRNYGKSGYTTQMLKGDIDNWDSNADLVVFFAGTNDFGRCDDLATTKSSVDSIFSSLKKKYPEKTVAVFLPLQRWGYTGDNVNGKQETTTNSKGITLRQYCDVIKASAEANGFPVLDLYNLSGINKDNIKSYTADGLHPNAEGFKKISQVMINFLNN